MISCLSICNMGKICQMVCYISDEKTCVFFPSERAVEGKQQRCSKKPERRNSEDSFNLLFSLLFCEICNSSLYWRNSSYSIKISSMQRWKISGVDKKVWEIGAGQWEIQVESEVSKTLSPVPVFVALLISLRAVKHKSISSMHQRILVLGVERYCCTGVLCIITSGMICMHSKILRQKCYTEKDYKLDSLDMVLAISKKKVTTCKFVLSVASCFSQEKKKDENLQNK